MTLIAIWYRPELQALYAMADSRMSQNGATGILTDSAPKFFTCRVRCYDGTQTVIQDSEILIGYAGSASVAFSAIATIQNCLNNLCLMEDKALPTMLDIGNFIGHILKMNYLDFGAIWTDKARCDLIVFGSLPGEKKLKSIHVGCVINELGADVLVSDLPIIEENLCCSFGSGRDYFHEKLLENMNATGSFHPYNLISSIISNGERPDIGGHIQIAFATLGETHIPLVVNADQNDDQKRDVYYLGRGSLELGKVGNCSIGRVAIGNS